MSETKPYADTPDQPDKPEQQDEINELDSDLLDILASVDKVSPNDLFDHKGTTVPTSGEGSIENPKLSHELYHGTIQALLRKHLPKMTSEIEAEQRIAKSIRRLKDLYLNDGKKKGVDGKMSYNHRKAAVASEIAAWVNEYGGANYGDLHGRLAKLCQKAGLKI